MDTVATSRQIVFLLAIRPLMNLLRGDFYLFELGSYKVSILSIWSLLLLYALTRRLQSPPHVPAAIKGPIQAFFLVVLVLGVPRILIAEALIKDVLMFTQFFLVAMSSKGVIEDVGFDFIVRRFTLSALVLVTIHATIGAAYSVESDEGIGSFLGLFPDKHLAAASFLVTVPFLICGAWRNRKGLAMLLLVPTLLAILLTFQRTSMVSVAIIGVSIVMAGRRLSWLVPVAVIGVIVVVAAPSGRMQEFLEGKIETEVDAFRSGEVEAVGANRIAIALLAMSQFEGDGPFEQLFGRGTAHGYVVAQTVLGTLVYAHIQVVELVVDYGVVGTALVLLILCQIGRSKWRSIRERHVPEELVGFAMLVMIFAQLFFAMPLQDGTSALLAFWLFPALTLSGVRRSDVSSV